MALRRLTMIGMMLPGVLMATCFPTIIGRSAPGVDFPVEGRPGFDPYWLHAEQKSTLLDVAGAVWSANIYGLHRVQDGGGALAAELVVPSEGELTAAAAWGSNIFIQDEPFGAAMFTVENGQAVRIQDLAWPLNGAVFANSRYLLDVQNGHGGPRGYFLYGWNAGTLEPLARSSFPDGSTVIGIGPSDAVYYQPGLPDPGVMVVRFLPDTGNDQTVNLPGETLSVSDAKIVGDRLYTLAYSPGQSSGRFAVYALNADPLALTPIGAVVWTGDPAYSRLIPNRDGASVLLAGWYAGAVVDLADPAHPVKGIPHADPPIGRADSIAFIASDAYWTSAGDLSLAARGPGADDPFVTRAGIDFPVFNAPNGLRVRGNRVTELFLPWHGHFESTVVSYTLDPASPDHPLTWIGTTPVPDCALTMGSLWTFDTAGGVYVFVFTDGLVTFDREGHSACLPAPWPEPLTSAQLQGASLFLQFGYSGFMVYDVSDAAHPHETARVMRERLWAVTPMAPPYALLATEVAGALLPKRLEVWDLSQDPPIQRDEVQSDADYLRVIYSDGSRWAYCDHSDQASVGRLIFPVRLTEAGRLEWAGGVELPWIIGPSFTPAPSLISPTDSAYFVMDLRDPGRPRPADWRVFPGRIGGLETGDALVFQGGKGYTLMDFCGTDVPEQLPFGWLDSPAQGQTVSGGTLEVAGWAWDPDAGEIQALKVLLDGQDAADAVWGLPRPDVAAARPGYAGIEYSGFQALLDVSALPPGIHRIQVIASDDAGSEHFSVIGIADFIVPIIQCLEVPPGLTVL